MLSIFHTSFPKKTALTQTKRFFLLNFQQKEKYMAKISWRAGTMLAPLPPALISCGTIEHPNIMTAAWTGTIASDPVITYVSIRPSRYSHEIISKALEFVINVPTYKMLEATDFCGVKSGRNVDKFKETGLHPAPCLKISAPQIAEAPISIECKVIETKRYGTHDMFVAEVLAVNVDDAFINEKGALDVEKAGLLAYAHGHYYTLGRKVGSFGFSVNKEYLKKKQKTAAKKAYRKESTPLKASGKLNSKPKKNPPAKQQKKSA